MTWMAYNQDDVVAGASGGQGDGHDLTSRGQEDHFIKFVLIQGIPVLIELIEVTIK